MTVPRIISVAPQQDLVLYVTFETGQVKALDIKPYLQEFVPFRQLKNDALFRSARVDTGGMGIVWNEQIDVSRYDAWELGTTVS